MRLGAWAGRTQRLVAVVLCSAALGGDAAEERVVLRGTGLVLLQVSADFATSVDNATRFEKAAKAALPKPSPRRHGRDVVRHIVLRENKTMWELFRSKIATKDDVDGGTVAMLVVIILASVVLGVFILSEVYPSSDKEYALEPGRKGLLQRQKPSPRQPAPTQMAAKAERGQAPLMPQPSPPADHMQAPPYDHAAANAPPSSLKGRFLQQAPLSRGNSFDKAEAPQSLPPAYAGSRPGTQPTSATDLPPRGDSSPHEIERLQMGSVGMTPIGSGKLGNSVAQAPSAAAAGAVVSASPILSYGSDSATSANHGTAANKPPPVCKELVLPHCEAWFAVPFDVLDSTHNGDFDLYGLSGKPLLRASVQTDHGMRKLSISMKPPKSPTLGSLVATTGANGKTTMQIKEKNEKFYGDLHDAGNMRFKLMRQEGGSQQEVLTVNYETARNQFELTSSLDGHSLASASRCSTSDFNELFHDVLHLEVRVNPGVDAVLALLCVMGVILFGEHSP